MSIVVIVGSTGVNRDRDRYPRLLPLSSFLFGLWSTIEQDHRDFKDKGQEDQDEDGEDSVFQTVQPVYRKVLLPNENAVVALVLQFNVDPANGGHEDKRNDKVYGIRGQPRNRRNEQYQQRDAGNDKFDGPGFVEADKDDV